MQLDHVVVHCPVCRGEIQTTVEHFTTAEGPYLVYISECECATGAGDSLGEARQDLSNNAQMQVLEDLECCEKNQH